MSRETTRLALRHLVLEQNGEQAFRAPALPIGLRGKLGPEAFDGRQAQFGEHQRQACGVGRGAGGAHRQAPTNQS
jgi:hypothetical protein